MSRVSLHAYAGEPSLVTGSVQSIFGIVGRTG